MGGKCWFNSGRKDYCKVEDFVNRMVYKAVCCACIHSDSPITPDVDAHAFTFLVLIRNKSVTVGYKLLP